MRVVRECLLVVAAFNCTTCVQEIKSCEGSEGVPVGCSSIHLYHPVCRRVVRVGGCLLVVAQWSEHCQLRLRESEFDSLALSLYLPHCIAIRTIQAFEFHYSQL